MRRDTQYIIKPPSIPMFLFKHRQSAWEQMIQWSKEEFQARLIYLAEHGYWRELKWMNENSSSIRILAELHGYRKMCARMTETVWNQLKVRDRRAITRAYELRDMMLRGG